MEWWRRHKPWLSWEAPNLFPYEVQVPRKMQFPPHPRATRSNKSPGTPPLCTEKQECLFYPAESTYVCAFQSCDPNPCDEGETCTFWETSPPIAECVDRCDGRCTEFQVSGLGPECGNAVRCGGCCDSRRQGTKKASYVRVPVVFVQPQPLRRGRGVRSLGQHPAGRGLLPRRREVRRYLRRVSGVCVCVCVRVCVSVFVFLHLLR